MEVETAGAAEGVAVAAVGLVGEVAAAAGVEGEAEAEAGAPAQVVLAGAAVKAKQVRAEVVRSVAVQRRADF